MTFVNSLKMNVAGERLVVTGGHKRTEKSGKGIGEEQIKNKILASHCQSSLNASKDIEVAFIC